MRRSNRAATQRSVSEDFQGNSIQSMSSNGEDPFSSCTLNPVDQEEAVELQRELKFFFMNPIEKYKGRGRKPYKFGVQVIKIFVVTVQLVLFAQFQYQFTTFVNDNKRAMEHIFLKDWDPGYDNFAYPSTKELYALYTTSEFYGHVDNVIYQYANIESIGIGTYNFDVDEETKLKIQNMTFKLSQYKRLEQHNTTFFIDLEAEGCKFSFHVEPSVNITAEEMIQENCHSNISFDRLIEFHISFTLKSIAIKHSKYPSARCIKFEVTIHYNYRTHGGRVPVTLGVKDVLDKNCTKEMKAVNGNNVDWSRNGYLTFDLFVMVLCTVSFILCLRSLLNGRHLKKKTIVFFSEVYDKALTRSDRMEFLNLWYVIICVSDCLTIAGSIFKIMLDFKVWAQSDYCSLLLGLATGLVWFGILRYLGFFNKYNILLVTFKKSMPNVLRFSICALIIYLAYGFVGWIILGPYHGKFRTFAITMECMFSLINGDDMFATYEEMPRNKTLIFVFSKIYLYSFISLFIYVVLSLFISVIMDTYETVKDFQRMGHIEGGDLAKFIALCEDGPESGHFKRKARRNWAKVKKSIRRYSSFEQTHHNQLSHQPLLGNGTIKESVTNIPT